MKIKFRTSLLICGYYFLLIHVFENERKQYDRFRGHSLGLFHLVIKSKIYKLLLKMETFIAT